MAIVQSGSTRQRQNGVNGAYYEPAAGKKPDGARPRPDEPLGPSLVAAVEEQLGLRLQRENEQVVLVGDRQGAEGANEQLNMTTRWPAILFALFAYLCFCFAQFGSAEPQTFEAASVKPVTQSAGFVFVRQPVADRERAIRPCSPRTTGA